MRRKRTYLVLGLLVLLEAVTPSDFGNAAESGLESLPSALAARQSEYLEKVEASAAQQFGRGSNAYYAALRQGLVRLGSAARADARGVANSFETMSSKIEKPQIGEDEEAQGTIDEVTRDRIKKAFELAKTTSRIVGGTVITTEDEFRDAIALGKANSLGCSGVVVHQGQKVHVLTAAHCICSLGLQTGGNNTKLYVGTNVAEGGGAVPLDFDDKLWMYQGSSCNGSATTITNKDLALVRFKNNKPNAHVRVATVASDARLQRALNDPFSYWIVGFGYQRNRNRYGVYELGDIGQKAYGYVFRTSECTGDASALPRGCLQSKEIVLSDSGTQVDTCAGDSGGPAYVLAANDASFRLVAITSRSTSPSGACGPGGIYGLIDTDAVDWIEEKLRESGEGTSAAIDRQN